MAMDKGAEESNFKTGEQERYLRAVFVKILGRVWYFSLAFCLLFS
jgi:hypothetical protein